MIDVGDRVIDNVPRSLKEFAIDQFGTNDKPILLASIGVVLAIYAMVVVALAFTRRLAFGVVGFVAFGLIGAYMAVTRRVGGSIDDVVPTVLGTAAGIGAIVLAHHVLMPLLTTETAAAPDQVADAAHGEAAGAGPDRAPSRRPIPRGPAGVNCSSRAVR